MRKKKSLKDRKIAYAVTLRGEQIEWIRIHKEFRLNKFIQDQLDKYIKFKSEVDKICEN